MRVLLHIARVPVLVAAFSGLAACAQISGNERLNSGARPHPLWLVSDYGAACDGKTNDTNSLQAALDAVGSAGGGLLLIPSGICLTGPLVLRYSNIHLMGAEDGLLFSTGAGAGLREMPHSVGPLLTVSLKATAFTISDLMLDGDKDHQESNNDGIFIESTPGGVSTETGGRMDHVRVINAKGNGITEGFARRGVHFLNVTVFRSGQEGLHLGGSDNFVLGCSIGYSGGDGIVVNNWTEYISGCDIFANRNGISLASNGAAQHITIVGNKIDLNKNYAIYMDDTMGSLPSNISVTANVFHNGMGQKDATIYAACNDCSITGNTFGPHTDQSSLGVSYSIVVPASANVGRQDVIGNKHSPHADVKGLLDYRGTIVDEYISGSTELAGDVVINGSLRLIPGTGSSAMQSRKPACDASSEGSLWYEHGSALEDGHLTLCQNQSGQYKWVTH